MTRLILARPQRQKEKKTDFTEKKEVKAAATSRIENESSGSCLLANASFYFV